MTIHDRSAGRAVDRGSALALADRVEGALQVFLRGDRREDVPLAAAARLGHREASGAGRLRAEVAELAALVADAAAVLIEDQRRGGERIDDGLVAGEEGRGEGGVLPRLLPTIASR